MPEIMWTGPFAALENFLAEALADARDPLRSTVILVGSQALAAYLRRRLAAGRGHLNRRILTFRELAAELAWEEPEPLNEAGEILRLDRVLRQEGGDFAEGGPSLRSSLRAWRNAGGGTPPAGLPRLFTATAARLQREGWRDERELLEAAAARVAAYPERFGTGELWVYGFYDLSQPEERLLESLANIVRLHILSPLRFAEGARYGRRFWLWARRRGFIVRELQTEPSSPLVARLLGLPTPGGGELAVYQGMDEEAEARASVREILAARSRGLPWEEMGILLTAPERQREIFQTVLGEYGVPFRGRRRPARTVLSALQALLDPKEGVGEETAWLTRLPWDPSWATPEELVRWESCISAWGPGARFEASGEADAGDDRLRLFRERTLPLLRNLPEVAPVAVFRRWLLDLSTLLEARAAEALVEAAEGLASTGEEGVVGRAAMAAALAEVWPEESFGPRDGVRVMELLRARGIGWGMVVIPGLAAGRLLGGGDPFLSEAERRLWNRRLPGRLPVGRDRVREARFLLTLGVEAARVRSVLTFSGDDPSPLLLMVAEAHLGRPIAEGELFRLPFFARVPPRNDRLAPLPARPLAAWRQRGAPHHGPFDGLVIQPEVQGELERHTEVLSPSRLQDFLGCPSAYFLERLLGLSPEAEALGGRRGRLLHRLLERLYCGEGRPGPNPEETLRQLSVYWEREANGPEAEAPADPLKGERRRLLEELLLFIRNRREEDAGWQTVGCEVPFGDVEPVRIPLPRGGSVGLRGVWDRLDRRGRRWRILDYKSGALPDPRRWRKGEGWQIYLYVFAAEEILGAEADEIEGIYESLRAGEGFQRITVNAAEAAAVRDELLDRVGLAIGEMRAGHFFPRPGAACKSCRVWEACPAELRRWAAIKRDDPTETVLRRLTEDEEDGG